jgi:hypothetical protein
MPFAGKRTRRSPPALLLRWRASGGARGSFARYTNDVPVRSETIVRYKPFELHAAGNLVNKLNLPEDLVHFLTSGKKLEYDPTMVEPGLVGLKRLEDLVESVIWINSNDSPLIFDDPNADADGYYEVPAVSLTGKCKSYDPEFISLWLPSERLFGSWDCDHWDLYIFGNKTWSDIVKAPALYLNSQWGDYERKSSEYFKPYPKYAFKKGRPF